MALTKRTIAASDLELLRDFDCGDEPWAREVAEWIRDEGGSGALAQASRGRCDVWLYEDDSGAVVGYGSLGTTRWKWPNPDEGPVRIAIIPWMGIGRRFQGQPVGPRENRYSTLILLDLIAEAQQLSNIDPAIGLLVHPENRRAINLYEYVGFRPWSHEYHDPDSGITYRGMILRLPPAE